MWWKEKIIEETVYDVGLGVASIQTQDGKSYTIRREGRYEG